MRRVQLPLLLVAIAALTFLPFLRHARNRLLSGQPIGTLAAIGQASPVWTAALAIGLFPIVLPLIRPAALTSWAGLVGVGIAIAAAAALGSTAADHLAATDPPSARTSLGAGAWLFGATLLLIASDTARRLRYGFVAILPVFTPLAALLALGTLAPLSLLREYATQHDAFRAALFQHILLVLGALLPALLIGVPLGIAAQRWIRLRRVAFPALNLIQTIPSIALFGLLIGPLSWLGTRVPGVSGIGTMPAIIALVLYSLLPIVRNTVEGLDGVPRAVRTAAHGMGMSPAQTFLQVDAALALPVLLSGLRVTAVQAVGLAAVSALIGAGGLGAIIFQGLFANALDLVILGALPVIALAVTADLLFRLLTAWSRAALGGLA